MKRIVLLSLLLFALACESESPQDSAGQEEDTGTVTQTTDLAAEEEALRTADRKAGEAFRSGDAAAFDALYADDAVLVNPGKEPLEGSDAIDSLHRAEMAATEYELDWEPIRVGVSESGDLGYVYGRWSTSGIGPDGSAADDHGYYVNVYEKVEGSWKTIVEVNGSSRPADAP